MKNRKGMVLMGVIVLLVLLAIVIPSMVKYIQNEAKWSVKQGQNANAFQLAESAVDRGYQKIAESTSTWQDIQDGEPQDGYHFDTVYRDMPGGSYIISLTSGPNSGEVTILTVGRDAMNKETRSLKVIYSKGGVDSAMYANGISVGGSVVVEWGPMKSRGSMTLGGAVAGLTYPRKYAVGAITGWATMSPCTDSLEYWAYNCSPGVPPPPDVDLTGYAATAQKTTCATASGFPAGADPAGSCYWPAGATRDFKAVVMTSTRTMYVAGDATVQNSYLWGNFIVTGTLDLKGGGKGAYTIPTAGAPAPFTGGIPADAWKEYQKMDTSLASQFVGDNGGPGSGGLSATFSFGLNGSPAKKTGTTASPSVRGFVYCGGTFGASGVSSLHGVVMSPIGISGLSGNISIYYDDKVAAAIVTNTIYPTRISWLDSRQQWPTGLE